MLTKRLAGAALLSAAFLPAVIACTDPTEITDATGAVCCSEFKVGATINADIGGSAQSQVAAQAVADFGGIASAIVDDLTAACRSIAQDLDTPNAEQETAERNADKQARLKAWCTAAVTAIVKVKGSAGGSLAIEAAAPRCEASVSAKANCQAKCSANGTCNVQAEPPVCRGGDLQVACKGECTAKGEVKLKCEGKCEGTCTGSCSAKGGVDCNGKCEGECTAKANVGDGVQSDGTCKGTCKGTCAVTTPSAECTGSCTGECGVKCTGTAEASVKCNGECKADFEPLKCEGGKLEGGCKVEAKCDANCDASVSAKAECTPPRVVVKFTGEGNLEAAGKLQATLEANLGVVLALRARLAGMASLAGTFKSNVGAVTDIKLACIAPMLAAVANAVTDVEASSKATIDIAGSVGVQ